MTNLLIAAGTRTGSVHIRNCFVRMGLKPVSLYSGEEDAYNEEHMLDRTAANVVLPLDGFVCLHHIRAIGRNVTILRDHKIRPVVTYRNALDCMVSWRDSHERGIQEMGERGKQWIFLPVYGPTDWMQLSDAEKWQWITFNVLPWWFSFYVSWKESLLDCLFINYKDHYVDQVAGLQKILRWLGKDDVPGLEAIAAPHDGRYNVGRTGRGRERLPEDIIEQAYKLAGSWGPHWGPILTKVLLEED